MVFITERLDEEIEGTNSYPNKVEWQANLKGINIFIFITC